MRQIHNAGIDSLFRNSAIDIQPSKTDVFLDQFSENTQLI